MDKTRVALAILISALITFTLRAIPFIVFRKDKQMPPKLIYLGKILPSAIMAVLVIYCLKDVTSNFYTLGISQLIAAIVVFISYKWKHNTFVSILLGTICNMILLRII